MAMIHSMAVPVTSTLYGGRGDDKFIYGRGSGNDIIQRDNNSYNGTDIVEFGEGLTVRYF